jgi:hypothetical protein
MLIDETATRPGDFAARGQRGVMAQAVVVVSACCEARSRLLTRLWPRSEHPGPFDDDEKKKRTAKHGKEKKGVE